MKSKANPLLASLLVLFGLGFYFSDSPSKATPSAPVKTEAPSEEDPGYDCSIGDVEGAPQSQDDEDETAYTSPKPVPSFQRRPQPRSDEDSQTVYITDTGEKYHRGSCRYLSHSKHAISLKDAKRGYTACKVCRPPQ